MVAHGSNMSNNNVLKCNVGTRTGGFNIYSYKGCPWNLVAEGGGGCILK